MRNIIGKKFYKQLVKDGKCLNTKLKYYDGKIKTNNRLSRLNTTQKSSPCFCYLLKMINITHRFIWKSVDMEKRNQRKRKGT